MVNRTNYYYDFHHPLPFVELVLGLLGRTGDPSSPVTDTGTREWFSQPRNGSSDVTECVTVNFRLPLSVSEISTEVLRMPCVVEVWYLDRSNNWRQVLDRERSPVRIQVSRADTKSWYKFQAKCYPLVAKKVQLRITRTADPVTLDVPYPVGIRNTLIRRNVYDRHEGGQFEDETDVMGNVVSKHIKDWDATLAADDNYTTFWKSAPQPDPAAVVSLFLDVRDDAGNAQLIDKLYIDPVYGNQHLNIYHSNDTTTGALVLSPITAAPVESVNVSWRIGRGLMASADDDDCLYSWPLKVGVQNSQDAWVGVEWRPDFASANADLPLNPILFAAQPGTAGAGPSLYYEPENRRFVLQFTTLDAEGQEVIAAGPFQTKGTPEQDGINEEWLANDSLRIVAGWRYAADGTSDVHIRVVDGRGRVIASLDDADAGVPAMISVDGPCRVQDFRGAIANLVVKLENHEAPAVDFIANPTYYCDPDPVIPDESNRFPSTSLDNAVYAATFTSREHGSGGADKSAFEDKEWVPVWRDYVVQKGMLFLPRAISMKYLKLEFTNLSEEPYPVYESGIEVKYKVFPVEVTQASSIGPRLYTGQAGFLGMGTFISINGVRSVNWLDPNSVLTAIGSVVGPQSPPVVINTGAPYITDSLPNKGAEMIEQSRRVEMASSYVYSRDSLQPFVLAADQYNTIVKAEGLQSVQPYVDVPWAEIEAANPGAVTKVKSVGTVPVRGTDWWIYPGQQLKVPASVMRRLTGTQTVTERKLTLESRVRFSTTSVHRYEYRTVKRDAAIAYFAGVREVQPYTSTYIKGEDKPVLDFPAYDPKTWVVEDGTIQDDETIATTHPNVPVVVSSEFETQSDFSRISLAFNDTGLVRSDSMWASPATQARYVESGNIRGATATEVSDAGKGWTQNEWVDYYLFTSDFLSMRITENTADTLTYDEIDGAPLLGGVYWISKSPVFNPHWRTGDVIDDDVTLAPYVDTIPSRIPGGTWADFNSSWSDAETVWGSPYGLVNISLDPDRRFMGRRVLRFTRAGGTEGLEGETGRAGIGVQQWTNFVPGSQFRIGCLIYRPVTTTNRVVLTLRGKDGVRVHEEKLDDVPSNQWFEYTSNFIDIPETLPWAGFENGFNNWITSGATWSLETDETKTRTGGKCAKLASTSATVPSVLESVMVNATTDTTVKASAWVRWQGLATGQSAPVIYLRAVFYDNAEEQVASFDLTQNSITPAGTNQADWVSVSGEVPVPRGVEAAQVSFELVVEETAGAGGTVWVDDFSVDVPYAPEQQYQVQLTLEGDRREEIYVSDLYTEVTPVRYFVQLGRRPGTLLDDEPVVWDAEPVEVTDLRYTQNAANVTRTEPANAFRVRAVLASNDAKLVGARIIPHYLK